MRSIKEQREELSKLDAHYSDNAYLELLDWAERARDYIKNMVPVLGGDGLGIVDRLLKELPEK